jgi:hypothetical protein
VRLTGKQIACLESARVRPVNPWHHGSTTISRLKREGLIVLQRGMIPGVDHGYVLTDAGRAALANVEAFVAGVRA